MPPNTSIFNALVGSGIVIRISISVNPSIVHWTSCMAQTILCIPISTSTTYWAYFIRTNQPQLSQPQLSTKFQASLILWVE